MTLSGIKRAVFVHGFLGLPDDWRGFARPDHDVCVDLWPLARRDGDPFDIATEAIVAEAILAEASEDETVLIAYSMGARLAMRALVAQPGRFRAAILISGNPGLASPEDRACRLDADRNWAQRFRDEPWAELMAAWNSQNVLAGGADLKRQESAFDRGALAWALENWSLGRQPDLRSDLAALATPILYVTGSEDKKFTGLGRELVKNPWHRHVEVAGAGHRLPWEKPREFIESANRFVQTAWSLA